MSTPTPHDAIFRKFFSDIEIANSFFEAYLPEKIKKKCDFSTLKIEPGSFVDDDLSQHHSDILYSLKVAGHKGYVYINVEHQSTPKELMPIRMFRYKLGIIKQHLDQGHKKAPAVIPILFYHGRSPYPYSLKLIDCFEDKEFAKEHFFDDPIAIDINLMPDEEIYTHKKLALLEIVQKHIFTRDLDTIADKLAKLVESIQPEHDLFNGLVYYMLLKGETPNVNKLIEKLKSIEDYREDVMNAAQQLKQQGLQQGREEARQGLLAIAEKLLTEASMSPQAVQKLTGLPKKEIMDLVSH
ncbi:Rpn family recombination-promoting nuclease/putative transposase [Rickettsiella endosymbiont of Dermanyssus gallinae]|uniref:Rpn family recombination-promoting nuclease/putative transposase n=1 Tax=Rickettsiella endosymbiont of Dermanyssus gallinae TaxID=2856608 RepID=UPI001C5319FC|nr:Rpn family recombination-promoting nuclease/putative transposase [Rickettsiella endosymbiont of Dermanyssus gallinae]